MKMVQRLHPHRFLLPYIRISSMSKLHASPMIHRLSLHIFSPLLQIFHIQSYQQTKRRKRNTQKESDKTRVESSHRHGRTSRAGAGRSLHRRRRPRPPLVSLMHCFRVQKDQGSRIALPRRRPCYPFIFDASRVYKRNRILDIPRILLMN